MLSLELAALKELTFRRSVLAPDGGEGDRTPDLVNAIHALSQLSYAPAILSRPPPGMTAARQASPRKDECQAIL